MFKDLWNFFIEYCWCCISPAQKYDKLLEKEGNVAFIIDTETKAVLSIPSPTEGVDDASYGSTVDILPPTERKAIDKLTHLLVIYEGWKGCVCRQCQAAGRASSSNGSDGGVKMIEPCQPGGCLKRSRGTEQQGEWPKLANAKNKKVSFGTEVQVAWTHKKSRYSRGMPSMSMAEARRNPIPIWAEIKKAHAELFPGEERTPAFGTRPDFREVRAELLAKLTNSSATERKLDESSSELSPDMGCVSPDSQPMADGSADSVTGLDAKYKESLDLASASERESCSDSSSNERRALDDLSFNGSEGASVENFTQSILQAMPFDESLCATVNSDVVTSDKNSEADGMLTSEVCLNGGRQWVELAAM